MLAMQTNYPPLPPENEATATANPPTTANAGAGRYHPPTTNSASFPGSSPIDASFPRGAQANEASASLNEVLHRSLMASSFTANEANEQTIPRAHSNGKALDLNALREAASREKKLFDSSMSSYDFSLHMAPAHPQWTTHPDNHHTDMPPKSVPTQETGANCSAKLGSFSPNVSMLPYTSAGSTKDLDYLLAANAARALVNHFGGGGGSGSGPQSTDDRAKSPSMGFREMVNPHISPQQPPASMETLYAHQRHPSDRSSPSRSPFGIPSLGAGGGAPPNMSAPFTTSPLSFPVPPHFRQNHPPYSPHPHHLLPPNPFGGLDPGFADRMKDYSTPHHLMDPRYPGTGAMSRLPRSTSPVEGEGRSGLMADSAMSDASPNSSTSGKFVSPHSQAGGTPNSGGNIVLYPWMNPKSCGKCQYESLHFDMALLSWDPNQ
ncbi:unnamed protein product [Mesocestoides corti]|uniref:GATA-type domain-containing protein n=1 Tax=Mesocestoides corti TaxID=53468 RepID=A0A0R3U943_MESCO|nr:unnamed protein product [Mesocestoides corti]